MNGDAKPSSEESPRPRLLSFNPLHLDPDKLLQAYGTFGRFQLVSFTLAIAPSLLYAANMMVMPFVAEEADDFSCHLRNNSQLALNYTVLDRCTVQDVRTGSNHSCVSLLGSLTYFEYKGGSIDTIAKEFNLVCEESSMLEHGSSIYLAGTMASLVMSTLSDRAGRRRTFLLTLWLLTAANLVVAFSPNYYFFLVLRAVAGFGAGGNGGVAAIMYTEAVAREFRDFIGVVGAFFWVAGYFLAGGARLLFVNWRWVYVCVSAPALLTIPYIWFLPESLYWMLQTGREDGVHRYIRSATRMNGPPSVPFRDCRVERPKELQSTSLLKAIRNPWLLLQFVIGCIVAIDMNLTYWALSLFSTDLSEDKMTGFFLSGLIEIPAGIATYFFLRSMRRKVVTTSMLTLTGSCILAAIYIPSKASWTMIFPLMAKMFNSIAWASMPLSLSEMAPTTIRNTFCGCIWFVGDLGSVASPYLQLLKGMSPDAPLVLICVLSFISAALALLQTDTTGKEMVANMSDFDGGPLANLFGGTKRKRASTTRRTPHANAQQNVNEERREEEEKRMIPMLEVAESVEAREDEQSNGVRSARNTTNKDDTINI